MKLPEEIETPLRNLLEALSEAKPEDLVPFDGTFRVKGTPIVIKVKPKTTMGELEQLISINMTKTNNKKILYIDMDNVLVNFQSGIDKLDEKTKAEYKDHLDDVPGIFALMDPVEGAVNAVHQLAEKYDLYILSTAPWNNPTAWCDKLNWVKKHFGSDEKSPFYKRIILTHHKNLCKGNYLIDDRPEKCGVKDFDGKVLHFGPEGDFHDWESVVSFLMKG